MPISLGRDTLQREHHNWIDGRPVPASRGDTFEARVEGTRTVLGRWPRSGERDLSMALDACERAETSWGRLAHAERRAELQRALRAFGTDGTALADTEQAFGATPAEVEAWIEEAVHAAQHAFGARHAEDERIDVCPAGAHVLALDWSEAFLGPLSFVLRALYLGRTLVIVADPRASAAADLLAHAFDSLPPGVVNLLHDDGRTVFRAAQGEERVARLFLPSTGEVVPELEERERASGENRTLRIERGFGAGLEIACASKLCVRRLGNTSLVVRADSDVADVAEDVALRAFGRLRARSGFAPGRVGRVLVPARTFSRFTETLLDVLEDDPDVLDPLEIARAPARVLVERAFRLGHDEGATAIFTGSEDDDLAFPLVFTNVEERMKLARATRPAPVLCLMRVQDEAAGRAIAARIDV